MLFSPTQTTDQLLDTDSRETTKFSTINLSKLILSTSTYTLLEKGLSYVPKPQKISISNIIMNKNSLINDLKRKSYRMITSQNKTLETGGRTDDKTRNKKLFTEKSTWEPPLNLINPLVQETIKNIDQATSKIIQQALKKEKNIDNTVFGGARDQQTDPLVHNFFQSLTNYDKNNLSRDEFNALKELKSNREIILKPSDKGGAPVIMDTENYRTEALRQLQNTSYYVEIPTTLAPQNATYIRQITDTLLKNKHITKSQHKYLTGPEDYSLRKFYLLPKIHKPIQNWPQPGMPEGRPIVSDTNSESSRIAEYIDSFIKPFSNTNSAFIKNSYDFVDKIKNKNFPPGYLLVTADVKSLYTNMRIDRMVQSVRTAFAENPDPKRPDKEIIDLLEYTLTHNDFTFDDKQYLQVCGCAMGKIYSPSLANIYLQSFDNAAKNNFEIKPELYFRFLDDIHFIWGGGVQKLLEYQTYLNTLIPGIEVTFEYSQTQISFLDILLYIQDNTIHTRTYFKPTDTHQLLHVDSYHPRHTTTGILKSQLIRFARLSSTYTDYHNTCNILLKAITHRGYTYSQLRKLKNTIWRTHGQDATQTETEAPPKTDIIPIIMNYSSLGNDLTKCYRKIVDNDFTMNNFKKIAAYKMAPNLKKLLVKSSFSNNDYYETNTITQTAGCFVTCNDTRCFMCKYNAYPATTISGYHNKKKHSIIGKLTCKSSNVIYVISCIKCKTQYVGETGQIIKDRLNNHFSTIRTKKPTPIAIHFTDHHDRTDMLILPVEKITDDENQVGNRKLREKYWESRLQTKYPLGLNGLPFTT